VLLPGLLFLGLALGLAAALRRWWDGVPPPWLVAFLALPGIALAPVLFGGQSLLPLDLLRGEVPFTQLVPTEPHGNFLQGDLLQMTAPAAAEVHRAASEGRWPLRSDLAAAGMPLLGDPHAQVLQPLAVAYWWLPPAASAGTTAALRWFVALTFTFLLLRRQGLGEAASALGATAWALGGFLGLWLLWPHANTAAWLPALLYALTRLAQVGARRDLVLTTLTAAALLLAGHPETILYAGLAALAFGGALARGHARPRALLGKAALAASLAGLLAAPALLPTALGLGETLRARNLSEGGAREASAAGALARLALVAAPAALGNDRFGAYWGPSNVNEDAAAFVGTGSLLLVVVGLTRRRRERRPQELLFLGLSAAALALGAPFLGSRLLLLVGFGLAYAAACEADRWQRGEGGPSWKVVLAAGGLGLALTAAFLAYRQPELLAVYTHGWWLRQGRFLAFAAAGLLALGWRRAERFRPALAPALTALVAFELLLLHLPAYPAAPARLAFPQPPVLAELARRLAPGERVVAPGRSLLPNLGMVYGLPDVRVYNPLAPAAFLTAVEPAIVGWQGEIPLFGRFDHPVYDRLGVRWVIVLAGTPLPAGLERVVSDASGDLWRRPGARGRLFGEGVEIAASQIAPTRLAATVEAARGATLTASVFDDGGWRGLVGGRRAAIERDGVLVALPVPAGRHEVVLLYRPTSWLVGLGLAAAALTALVALGLAPPRRPQDPPGTPAMPSA
jgi:hypothetical protein